ncbi:MAG: MBL fold metallo-hydrolase [Chitinophagaceae bacterium]|nr:MBL fold metallo-hydrolase [Chitinophagaceae bacterium]
MQIIPLSEGSFTVDNTKQFVPFEENVDDLQKRSKGSLLVEIQPFVVITSRDVLLLDTGLGFSKNGSLQIHQNLKKAGIAPEQITRVLLTHLHKDHAGGVSFGKNKEQLSFPNATYHVQQRELEFAVQKGFPSFIIEDFQVLENSNQVQFLNNDRGTINDYVSYEVTAAHSKFHQVFWIKESNETIFFGGDDAPQLQQMKIRYKTKYDYNPEKAMKLRQQWWVQANKEGWSLLFYHDTKTPVSFKPH